MRNHNPQNHRTRFKSPTLPENTELSKKAIGVKFPLNLDKYLRSLPDISGFVRQSVIEKLERDHLLPLPDQVAEVAINTAADPVESIEPPAPPEPTPAKKTRGKSMSKRSDV